MLQELSSGAWITSGNSILASTFIFSLKDGESIGPRLCGASLDARDSRGLAFCSQGDTRGGYSRLCFLRIRCERSISGRFAGDGLLRLLRVGEGLRPSSGVDVPKLGLLRVTGQFSWSGLTFLGA